MRRLIYILLALSLALCSCGKEREEKPFVLDEGAYAAALAAVEGFNGEETRQTAVIFSLTEGEESRYFNQGTYSYSRKEPIAMSGKSTEVYGGDGVSMDVYYKAGAYYYSGKAGKFYEVFDRELFLKQYICTNLRLCGADKVTRLRTAQTSAGTKYVFTAVDEEVFRPLFVEVLSMYAGVKKPQAEKTQFKNGEFICVLDENGALADFCINCEVLVYDTPAYYPTGYVPTEGELCHTFKLSYQLNVKALGDSVKIETPETKDYTFLG